MSSKLRSVAATTLRLYDDRLEMWNSGNLPVQLRIGDLLQEHNSYPFNKLIAEIFYNLGIIERWGSGTLRMAESLTEQGLAPPTFDVSTADTFKLIVHSQKSILSKLSKRQWKALQHLQTVDSLTVAEYQELTGVSKATATRDLRDMTIKGVLVSEGRGKGSKYRPASKLHWSYVAHFGFVKIAAHGSKNIAMRFIAALNGFLIKMRLSVAKVPKVAHCNHLWVYLDQNAAHANQSGSPQSFAVLLTKMRVMV